MVVWGKTADVYVVPSIKLDVADSVIERVRQNLIPNPRPRIAVLTGWNHSEATGTLLDYTGTADGIHYKATVDGPGAQVGVGWNDATELDINAGERYALILDDLTVTSIPATSGFLRAVILWYDAVGAPLPAVFGTPLGVGTYLAGDPALRVVATAPATARYASVALLWNSAADASGDATPVEWEAGGWLLEPLGLLQLIEGARVNMIAAPTLEHCTPGNPAGGGDGYTDGTGWLEHVGGATGPVVWANDNTWTATGRAGGRSRRATVTAGAALLPNGMRGFVGSYVGPVGEGGWQVAEGESFKYAARVNVLANGLPGDPGVFLEMFWFFYDGDPAHTVLIQQDNSPGIYTPAALATGEQTLVMTGTCPTGANALQVTAVMGTTVAGRVLDFYTDCVILTPTDNPADLTPPAWFDGDTENAGWDGIPGYSTSRLPGIDALVPGAWFDGDSEGASWEGTRGYSVSTVPVMTPGWLSGAVVGSWSLDRELVASTIPGNLRQRNGLSIGAASTTVRPANPAAPWSTTPATQVTSGVPANLYAQASDGTTKPLGAWVTDETDGNLTSDSVPVDLLEAQYAGRDVPPLLPAYNGPDSAPGVPAVLDPVWAISRLLTQIGFPSTPPVADPTSLILAIPADGGLHLIRPAGSTWRPWAGGVDAWETLYDNGPLCGSFGTMVQCASEGQSPISDRFGAGASVYLTLDVIGTVAVADLLQGWELRIVNDSFTSTHTIAVTNGSSVTPTPVDPKTYAEGLSQDWPHRIQVELQRSSVVVGVADRHWSQFRARARTSPTAAWSAWSTHTIDTAVSDLGEMLSIGGNGRWAGVCLTTTPDPALFAPAKAILKPLGGHAGFPTGDVEVDVWENVQDACSANLAACIINLDGIARVLNFDDLAGANVVGDVIDVGTEWEDLGWAVDAEDTADRVALTYSPATITDVVSDSAPQAGALIEIVTVPAGETATIPVAFENRAARGIFTTFIIPDGTPDWRWAQNSLVCAFDNPEGTGTPLTDGQFRIVLTASSASSATVQVTNLTAAPLYLVDGNGEPCLIIQARRVATFGTTRLAEAGASADTARTPLELNLGTWVQSDAVAGEIARRLWDRVSGPGLWKASAVKCRLDWSLDIGQVRRIRHDRSGLVATVLITKVHLDGDAGQIDQSIDLVVLAPTYDDFAAAWPSATYDDFAALQGARTYADHSADPLWTGA